MHDRSIIKLLSLHLEKVGQGILLLRLYRNLGDNSVNSKCIEIYIIVLY